MDFLLGVVSSMVASILLLVLAYFNSAVVRKLLVRLLSRLTGVGIVRVHPTQTAANADLRRALADAGWVKVFAGRGNELTRDSFAALWSEGPRRPKTVDILLPRPDGTWLKRREAECAAHDRGFGDGVLADQVRSNVKYLRRQTLSTPDVDLRTYDFPQICRIIATDQVVYLTPYAEGRHGRNSTCLVFGRSSPMYELALRIFDSAWVDAAPASAHLS